MVEVVYIHTVYLYFIGKIRVFFKVLSSQSFLKVNGSGSKGPIQWAFPASFSHNYIFISRNPIWQTKRHIVHTFLPSQEDLSKDSPHQNVFKLTLSQKSFYVFRKDRQCKFIFLLSPSLDLMNIISVRTLEGMKVAGKTLQRSRHTLPTASFYLQP